MKARIKLAAGTGAALAAALLWWALSPRPVEV